jgi:hypothetical protein
MTVPHHFAYPKVTELRVADALVAAPAPVATQATQRELVVASLLRCPDPLER